MAMLKNDNTALHILKEHLEVGVKTALKESLLSDALERYRLSIEPLIDEEVRKITLGKIETWRDYADINDVLKIHVSFNRESA
jgi:limonene-1,2-epoxide hydrolase